MDEIEYGTVEWAEFWTGDKWDKNDLPILKRNPPKFVANILPKNITWIDSDGCVCVIK